MVWLLPSKVPSQSSGIIRWLTCVFPASSIFINGPNKKALTISRKCLPLTVAGVGPEPTTSGL